MSKILKIAGAVVGVLIVGIVLAGLIIYQNRDEIVRRATEEALTYALKVECTVEGATVEIGQGLIELNGIVVGNPPGFESDYAMSFSRARVEADIGSFRTDEPTIRLIQISDPTMVIERRSGTTNLQALLDNASAQAEEDEQDSTPPEEKQPSEKAVKIERVLVEGTTVKAVIPMSAGKDVSLTLPTLEMTDLGGQKEKTTPAEAMRIFIAEILSETTQVGGDLIPEDMLAGINESIEGLPDNVRQEVGTAVSKLREQGNEELQKASEEAQEAVGKAAEDVQGALGGLLGGRKNKQNESSENEQ